MPYVPPAEALNLPALDLPALRREAGPLPWRRPLAASQAGRWVLAEWPPGFAAPPHYHPYAEETFHVLAGRGLFRFGDSREEVDAPAGSFLFAPRGLTHAIRVPGPESLLLLVCVTPNESRPDETVEPVQAGAPDAH
jgi:mannose-6-phosphate isomerase-like protein (cupin superfamily)